jgi:hypothetical protein
MTNPDGRPITGPGRRMPQGISETCGLLHLEVLADFFAFRRPAVLSISKS